MPSFVFRKPRDATKSFLVLAVASVARSMQNMLTDSCNVFKRVN